MSLLLENLKICSGNLLESECQTLTNTVNCVGVMGKGIALEFKKEYPEMFDHYKQLCNQNRVRVGFPYVYEDFSGKNILNFPTKSHWRKPSELKFITDGLTYLVENYKEMNIESLAVPGLGTSNGGLDMYEIYPLMAKELLKLDIPVEIYLPLNNSFTERDKLKDRIIDYVIK